MNWSNEEVAYWMSSINFEQYAFDCFALPIDGDMLIRDIDKKTIIEDMGVLGVHSNRILRQINDLRRIIQDGFDEEVFEGITIAPNLERPTMDQIESLQERIEKLEEERATIMQELESKNDNEEESGYFSTKIAELEGERNELKEANERFEAQIEEMKDEHEGNMENIGNSLKEASNSNEQLRREIKSLKKEVRKAKRMAAGDDFDDEESEEEIEEENEDMEEVESHAAKRTWKTPSIG